MEFLVRALTAYAWYVATGLVSLGVLLAVLSVVHYVRKWRKRHWFGRRIPDATPLGNSDTLGGGFASGRLRIPSDRRSDGA